MGRMLKNFWPLSLSLMLVSPTAFGHSDLWDGLIKRLAKKGNKLTITAPKGSPKAVAFRGVLEVPAQIHVLNGSGQVSNTAGQIIFDDQIVCSYSPVSNLPLLNKIYGLRGCSDGSRAHQDIQVNNKVELRLNAAHSSHAVVQASLKIVRQDEESYGLVFPYITPDEGNILIYNGEAWVPVDPSEILPEGGVGEQGPAGPEGPQGPMGPQGPQGEKGDKGDKGDPGVAGAVGPQGPAGPAGATGATGAIGPQGLVGPKGDKGDPGVAGAAGPQGPVGPAGAVGPMGPQGPAGADGAPGVAGPVGPQGPQGPKGDSGTAGATGPQGPAGPMGLMGPMGPQGPAGADGAPGVAGPIGPVGPQGPQGPQGEKGDKGDPGLGGEIAYMRDERATGAAGGDCIAGQWNPRTLNILGGDTNFISLANNRFTLQPGKYFVEIVAPGHGVNQHQAKLKVIETNTDALYGTNIASASNAASTTLSVVMGEIIVATTSTFEIQHRCATTKTTVGFGAPASFGSPEIYTQVKIIKK